MIILTLSWFMYPPSQITSILLWAQVGQKKNSRTRCRYQSISIEIEKQHKSINLQYLKILFLLRNNVLRESIKWRDVEPQAFFIRSATGGYIKVAGTVWGCHVLQLHIQNTYVKNILSIVTFLLMIKLEGIEEERNSSMLSPQMRLQLKSHKSVALGETNLKMSARFLFMH